MFALRISYHARTEEYIFAEVVAADAEMKAIESKIGKKWYGKNGDEETPTYRFRFADGEAAICLEKVESVSVFPAGESEFSKQMFDMGLDINIRRKLAKRAAEEAAGLTAPLPNGVSG